jgi:hypothetical protein
MDLLGAVFANATLRDVIAIHKAMNIKLTPYSGHVREQQGLGFYDVETDTTYVALTTQYGITGWTEVLLQKSSRS